MAYRVVQFFTGVIARENIRLIAADPQLELVGAVVHSESKDGVDVGEIAGIEAMGVRATRDVEQILAMEADCVLYNAPRYDIDQVERILRSGKNVVTISGGWYPQLFPAEFERLEAACLAGNVSLFGTGNMPGLIPDALPLFMSGFTAGVERITARERTYHRNYNSREVMLGALGYGSEIEEARSSVVPEVYHQALMQPAYMVAHAHGVDFDEFRLTKHELAEAPRDIYLPSIDATIREGSVAGMRFEFSGFVRGRPWYVMEVEHVVELGLGAGWRANEEEPEFSVRIDGRPSLSCDFHTVGPGGGIQHVLELNAARIVNSIRAICAAEPGICTLLDLPLLRSRA